MALDFIYALGVLLTALSQLRAATRPVGPGELLLAFWIVATFVRLLTPGRFQLTPALTRLGLFWILFAVALSLGIMMALATGEDFDTDFVFHDVLAFPLIGFASALSVAGPGAAVRMRRIAWFATLSGAVLLLLQLANGLGMFSIPILDPWFWERFRGWSSNPNQLALLCMVLFFVALYLADTARSALSRLVALVCLAPPVVLGRMSGSDTLSLAILAGLLIYAAGKAIVALRAARSRPTLAASLLRLMIITSPLMMLSLVPIALTLADDAQKLALGFTKNGGRDAGSEADLRMVLWRQALSRGIESGLLGLGPGPHLQIPASISAGRTAETVKPMNVVNPDQNGTANFEAHNTLLDLFTQGGLLAVVAFSALLINAGWRAYIAESPGLVALLGATVLFGMTGLIARQPIFWLAVSMSITAEAAVVMKRATPPRYRTPAEGMIS